MKALGIVLGLVASWLLPAQASPDFRLDATAGVGGVQFGRAVAEVPGLLKQFTIGKRWRTTQLYKRPNDTTRFHGVGVPDTYWFRQNRFIGTDFRFHSDAEVQRALRQLSAFYGPARPDTLPDHWYWLGQRSYILLGRNDKNDGELFVASLAMLNEQVYETAVRAQARRMLGWRPDSVGLPHQFPVR